MKNLFTFWIGFISVGGLTGCYMDAQIGELANTVIEEITGNDSSIAVGPSIQHKATDDNNQYKARSAVGEVTSGISHTGDNVYSAEISITYQRL